ncbi:MAG: hypothetical protein QM489_00585 [Candidatus Izemoplasma sp.]
MTKKTKLNIAESKDGLRRNGSPEDKVAVAVVLDVQVFVQLQSFLTEFPYKRVEPVLKSLAQNSRGINKEQMDVILNSQD